MAELKFERYGLGIIKGLSVTMKNLLGRTITSEYPEKKLTVSRRFRGNHLVWCPERCTGCATCAKMCPQGNIEIVTSRDSQEGNCRLVDKFELDTGRCIMCGLCVEACPFDALYMGLNFERATYRREELVLDKNALTVSDDMRPSGYFRPKTEAALPKQSLLIERA
ncbi:MAG: NADH-quinone oxidoreductase subunit I, partial [Dehalococcoidia bacterium]|nr:NADH-quinone oxidoreductase subunit I [Dehalococcoidia bacterium]